MGKSIENKNKVIQDLIKKIDLSKPTSKEERENQINYFISSLKELWMKYPEQRFAQILYNYTKFGTPKDSKQGPESGIKDFFYYEDRKILQEIKNKVKK